MIINEVAERTMQIKTQFSIKDLENLSGVKAHTIRIWEKRYNLLEPERSDTNIRQYDLINLKKLLNITFLYNEGYKISKIAGYPEEEINRLINLESSRHEKDYAIQEFKTAMFDFDHVLFSRTYHRLIEKRDFTQVFFEVFVPLLQDIGLLWQTNTIDPVHERFISELIRQKLIVHIDAIQESRDTSSKPEFALYLPHEEIHEIGLLFSNYLILRHGFNSIYLGNNIPLENLRHISKHYDKLTFLSYLTVKPDQISVREYAAQFNELLQDQENFGLLLMGAKTQIEDTTGLPQNIRVIDSLHALNKYLESLKNS